MENEVLAEGHIFACNAAALRGDRVVFAILMKDNKGDIRHLRVKGTVKEMTADGQYTDIGTAMLNRVPVVLVSDGSDGCHFEAKDCPDQKIMLKSINWIFD